MLLFIGGLAWLLGGMFLAIIASVKLHAPGFLAHAAWLTVGRLRPAAMNALIYGFATPVSLGVLMWMLARLGGLRLLYPGPVFVAGLMWNFGVVSGVLGLLAVGSTGFEWLEMPPYTPPLLLIAFLVLAISALMNFSFRREKTGYVSQWYLLAGLFWFVWIYSASSYLLLYHPVRGVLQAVVGAWFTSNLLGLWLTSVGLAIVFYFIPKLLQRPLQNYWLAVFGFWTLAVFGSWTGLAQFAGGPLPRWMVSVSGVANGLMIVPVLAVALNWHWTLVGKYHQFKTDFVLRFVLAGAVSYLAANLLASVVGFQPLAALTQLTLVPVARVQLALHGFVGLTLLGALYYILPRLLQVNWPSMKLVRFHWLASVIGVALMFVALLVGGLIQGGRLLNPDTDFVSVLKSTIPFLGNAALGLCVLLTGQVALGWNLGLMLWQYCQQSSPVTELLEAVDAAEAGGRP